MKIEHEEKSKMFVIKNNETISPINCQKLIIQIDNKRGFILFIGKDNDSIELLAYEHDENGTWSEEKSSQFNLLPHCSNMLQLKLDSFNKKELIQNDKEILNKVWPLRRKL